MLRISQIIDFVQIILLIRGSYFLKCIIISSVLNNSYSMHFYYVVYLTKFILGTLSQMASRF